jgi:predicted dehydrogenase
MNSSEADKSTLRGALIGFGQVAEKAHLPAFKEHGIQITAVCESSAARREAAQAALPDAKLYTSYEQLLEAHDGIDFVDIATPPFLHAEQALAALKRGIHVLCEKPLALAPEELETLRRSAAMAGRAVFTVHNWAYSPQWQKAFEVLASGALGEIRHVELHALRTQPAVSAVPGDWRREAGQAGGGILIDHGWHNLYLLHRLIRAKPTRVTARLHPASGAVEEEATITAEFPNATALVYLTWQAGIRRNTALVVGTKAVLELLDDEIVVRSASGSERFPFADPLSAGSAHPTWFSAMIPDFIAETSTPSARGRNLEEAAFCLGVIHRAYQAVRHGRNPLRAALTQGERSRRS